MKNKTPEIKPKNPSQMGKWTYKPLKSKVAVCACGNRYIATRAGQTKCIICMRNK